MNKHILVTSQCFYPEQFRINDICTEWVKMGYKITVLTGIPNYPKGKFFKGYGLFKNRKENYNGMDIIRIPIIPRRKNVVMMVLNYFSFVVSGFFWKAFTRISADYVFMFETSPMTQALVGTWYAKRRKIPCYIYVQDLWPDNVEIMTGIKSKIILGPIGSMVDYIYKRCTKIFTTSNSFKDSIMLRGVPKEKIECWPQYAEDFYKPMERESIAQIPDDGAFNLVFAGNLGYAQGLDVLVKAADIIKKENLDKKIRFNIIGDGRYKAKLTNMVKVLDVKDMFNFIQRQPAIQIPRFMATGDAGIISLIDRPLFTMTIPAKVQSYMACGVPIIASVAGETADIINTSKAGLCSPPADAEKLAENIIIMARKSKEELKVLGANARQYYLDNFDKNMLLDKINKYFED